MSLIVATFSDGSTQQITLSKTQPLMIGRLDSCDVRIADERVGMLHARISWAKRHFELTAAQPDGVEVNGQIVRNVALNVGDLIRAGEVDLLFTTEEELERTRRAAEQADDDSEEIGLSPISEEIPAWQKPSKPPSRPVPGSSSPPAPKPVTPRPAVHSPSRSPQPVVAPELSVESVDDSSDEPFVPQPLARNTGTPGAAPSRPTAADGSPLDRLRQVLDASRQRPGEQKLSRSPLVLSLGGGGALLLIAAVVFWILIGREESKRYFEAAELEHEQRRYIQAIQRYEDFLSRYPGDSRFDQALRQLSRVRVKKEIDTSAPDWTQGLEQLKGLIDRHRDDSDFDQLYGDIAEFSQKIALGSCLAAERQHDRKYFDVSEEAVRLIERYQQDESRRNSALREIDAARRQAEAALIKHAAFEEGIAAIGEQIKTRDALRALEIRKDLQRRYAEFKSDATLEKLYRETLALEKGNIALHDEVEDPLPGEDAPPSPTGLSLSGIARARIDEPRSGRAVCVLAADALVAIDTGNGDPLWSRTVGERLPFFPLEVSVDVEGLLLYSRLADELWMLDRDTGRIVWRQATGGAASGTPLILEGHAYLATRGGELLQLDLASGAILSRLRFSQPLMSSPALIGEARDRCVVVGEREVVYLVSLRPLAIVEVIDTAHHAGAIVASPLRMGPLVLIAENDRAESARLRVFDTRGGASAFAPIAEDRLSGAVRDDPALRGRQLIVASWPERFTAYTVSAEADQPPLARVGEVQVPAASMTSAWIAAGPDGQIWTSGTALRKLRLGADAFEFESNSTAAGIATQPLRMLGEDLYVARRTADSSSVRFSRIHRETFNAAWRTTLGDAIRITTLNSAGELVALTDSGDVYRLGTRQVSAPGYATRPNLSLELPPGAQSPAWTVRLTDGRIVVATAAPKPTLFVIRPTGQLHYQQELEEELEAAPIDFGEELVVPVKGRLRSLRQSGVRIDDYVSPLAADAQPARWHSLLRLDAEQCLAFDRDGRVLRIQRRDQPVPSLALVAESKLDSRVVGTPLLLDADRAVLLTTDGAVNLLDTRQLQIESRSDLPQPALAGPWLAGDWVFAQVGEESLVCLDPANGLQVRWQLPLERDPLAGAPTLFDGRLVVPLQSGRVVAVELDGGVVQQAWHAARRLTGPVLEFGQARYVTALDGTLLPLGALTAEAIP